MLLYECVEDGNASRLTFGVISAACLVPIYFFARAIQRRSLWRICVWSVPAAYSFKLGMNSVVLSGRIISHMYLKENGNEVVIYTTIGRKYVVSISDIEKTKNYIELIQQLKMTSSLFTRIPIRINDNLFLINKDTNYC